MTDQVYHKVDNRHPEALELEELGLKWLAEPMCRGGAHVVRVAGSGRGYLDTELIPQAAITLQAARSFGAALAFTHAGGADWYGQPPLGYSGLGLMGRSSLDLIYEDDGQNWGEFFAVHRIMPNLPPALANGSIDRAGAAVLEKLAQRLRDGVFDVPEPELVMSRASRIHGDLWTGNIIWAPSRALKRFPSLAGRGDNRNLPLPEVVGVLIDPAPSGGHAESDLAALGVFGQPYLEEIYRGYNQVSPLASGWQERINLHQIHMLAVHANLFGGSYGSHTVDLARQYL